MKLTITNYILRQSMTTIPLFYTKYLYNSEHKLIQFCTGYIFKACTLDTAKIKKIFHKTHTLRHLSISRIFPSVISPLSKRIKEWSIRCMLKLRVFLLHNRHNLLTIFIEDTRTKTLINNLLDGASLRIYYDLLGLG